MLCIAVPMSHVMKHVDAFHVFHGSLSVRRLEMQRQKEAYERQVREAERKRDMEREKAEKREQDEGARARY